MPGSTKRQEFGAEKSLHGQLEHDPGTNVSSLGLVDDTEVKALVAAESLASVPRD